MSKSEEVEKEFVHLTITVTYVLVNVLPPSVKSSLGDTDMTYCVMRVCAFETS